MFELARLAMLSGRTLESSFGHSAFWEIESSSGTSAVSAVEAHSLGSSTQVCSYMQSSIHEEPVLGRTVFTETWNINTTNRWRQIHIHHLMQAFIESNLQFQTVTGDEDPHGHTSHTSVKTASLMSEIIAILPTQVIRDWRAKLLGNKKPVLPGHPPLSANWIRLLCKVLLLGVKHVNDAAFLKREAVMSQANTGSKGCVCSCVWMLVCGCVGVCARERERDREEFC